MLHKAWNSKGEMPYCFPMSSIKFQGHTVQNITDFDPNWAFPDYRLVAAFKSLRFALFGVYLLFFARFLWDFLLITSLQERGRAAPTRWRYCNVYSALYMDEGDDMMGE